MAQVIERISPSIELDTPKGRAYAHFLIDYGETHNLVWVCFIRNTGECWSFRNPDVCLASCETMGVRQESQDYEECLATGASLTDEEINGAFYRQEAESWREKSEFFERQMDRDSADLRQCRMALDEALAKIRHSRQEVFDQFERTPGSPPLGGASSVPGAAAAPTLAGRVAGAAGGASQAAAGGAPGAPAAAAPSPGDSRLSEAGDHERWEWDSEHDGFRWRKVVVRRRDPKKKRTRDSMGRLLDRKS